MSDVDRLTIVVACLGTMLIARLPERPSEGMSLKHLTFDLASSLVLVAGVWFTVLSILGWRPPWA